MLRIVNAGKVLAAMAAADRRIEQVIRVHDNIVTANNGVYILHNGNCEHADSTMRKLTLDVNIATLAAIIFSSAEMGLVFGLDTHRAMLPLMLD